MKQQSPRLRNSSFTYNQSYRHYEHANHTPQRRNKKSRSPIRLNATMPRGNKIDNLISNLYQKHEQMKKHLQKLREQKEVQDNKQVEQYDHIPKISHSKRYHIHGTFTSRNQDLIKSRKDFYEEHSQKKKEEEIKPCVFKPTLVAKKKSMQILERRKLMEESQQQTRNIAGRQDKQRLKTTEPKKNRQKSLDQVQPFSVLKNLIKTELRRIQLP